MNDRFQDSKRHSLEAGDCLFLAASVNAGDELLLFQPDRIKPESYSILERVLLLGEMTRGEAEQVSELKERTSRQVLSNLVEDGILGSATPKGPVSLRFPSRAVDILFPRLFTDG